MRASIGDHLVELAEKVETADKNGKRRNLPPEPGATMINVPGNNPTVVIQHSNPDTAQIAPPKANGS
jgi:hypothetical protein